MLALLLGCSRERAAPQQATVEPSCVAESTGPWTATCSAAWVAKIVEKAGYRLTGDTQSAWVATGRGTSFYIWATDRTAPVGQIARRESYRLVARVAGTKVYDDSIRKFWAASGYIIWIEAGPRGGSIAPKPTELGPLIRASRAAAAPP
jgi:hypothetical protein